MTIFSLRSVFPARVATVVLCIACLPPSVSAHPGIESQIQQLDHDISLAPQNAELVSRRAELFRQHGQFKEALDDLDAVVRLMPGNAQVHYYRARLLQDMERHDDALNQIELYIAASPAGPDAYFLLARIERAMGRINRSVDAFGNAIRRTARPNPDHYIELAAMQRSIGENAAALNTLEQGISKLGPIVSLQLTALGIETESGLFDAALRRIDVLKNAGMQDESRLILRARVLALSGRRQESIELCRQIRQAILAQTPQRQALPATQNLLTEVDALLAGASRTYTQKEAKP